ncbi:RNA polymerase sigma factor sigA [Sesamum angolense]|uniref:RNA polymerase sigma factor sigA n=1 Tax=Sesamum angolense TaxID=2727404 RepID=A0AAE1VZR2_9LAMI|nr:RNA polymerase sigma factor sigA [Sesamum angolense]
MATAAVIGLSTGKRLLLSSTFYYSDLADKLACTTDPHYPIASTKMPSPLKKWILGKKVLGRKFPASQLTTSRQWRSIVSPELLQNRLKGYVKGVVSEELLTHAQVVQLSEKIKAGLLLEEHKSRLKERLGYEPSDEQLATSLRISRTNLQSKLIECSLAREKLAMSNIRLVMSIAQRYDNMGAEMADLIQGGLIGLLRGIEKFDSSKGFKISTYVYWWIRQVRSILEGGVSRALVENCHLTCERLSLISKACKRPELEEKGITPSIDRIAECLNMSQKKVKNATEAISKYIMHDNHVERISMAWSLMNGHLRIGLSRERVRQVGLVALEKLKHAARKRRLDAMLVQH